MSEQGKARVDIYLERSRNCVLILVGIYTLCPALIPILRGFGLVLHGFGLVLINYIGVLVPLAMVVTIIIIASLRKQQYRWLLMTDNLIFHNSDAHNKARFFVRFLKRFSLARLLLLVCIITIALTAVDTSLHVILPDNKWDLILQR